MTSFPSSRFLCPFLVTTIPYTLKLGFLVNYLESSSLWKDKNIVQKVRCTYVWNFIVFFFHLFLNNLNSKSVCYVSKYGYVSWCIVWNEVSKSVQKDKKLFVIQIAHEAHPFMKLMTHLPPTTSPLSWSHLPPNPTPFMSLPPVNPTPFMKPIPLMKLIPLKNTAFFVSVKNEALEKWLWKQQIQVK